LSVEFERALNASFTRAFVERWKTGASKRRKGDARLQHRKHAPIALKSAIDALYEKCGLGLGTAPHAKLTFVQLGTNSFNSPSGQNFQSNFATCRALHSTITSNFHLADTPLRAAANSRWREVIATAQDVPLTRDLMSFAP
jgi:hypothetical protein